MDWFADPSKALLPPDLTLKTERLKAANRRDKPWLPRYAELSRLVTSYEVRVQALEHSVAELRQALEDVLTTRQGDALLMNAQEAGGGVHTGGGMSAGGNTHSSIPIGLDSGVSMIDTGVLESAGILRRCHSCGKVIPVVIERDGVGSRKRGWKRFCDKGCRLDWEARAGKRWGGVRQTGLQTRYRGVYRDGVYVLYRWLVGKGFVGMKVIREAGVLGMWYFEKGVGSDPRRFKKLVDIMVGLGLLEARLVPVGGLQRREWRVLEPVVQEMLGSGI